MDNKAAKGSIYLRKDGRYEVRIITGRDPSGKQIRKSYYAKTEDGVQKLLTEKTYEINNGIYIEPSSILFGEWLETWLTNYCGSIKLRTRQLYEGSIKARIAPALGSVELSKLKPEMIQQFYNEAVQAHPGGKKALSPKTVKNLHGIIHKALKKAVELGYLRVNPSDPCELPDIPPNEIRPMDSIHTRAFIDAISEEPLRRVYLVALFTGMRLGEILGLTWNNINFNSGQIKISQQLQQHKRDNGKPENGIEKKPKYEYSMVPPKNKKTRIIIPAPFVMDLLREERNCQEEQRRVAGKSWRNTLNLVFTNGLGGNLTHRILYYRMREPAERIGMPELRFHDLRHTYAVNALRAGDDAKTVSENLGHASVEFTLNVYCHLTDEMKRTSANNMQRFIDGMNL